MRIATWNVNSIRSRIDRVTGWLERNDVDVLAIQETKCREDQFPGLELSAMGYEYAHRGLSQWNGVAIISRVGLDDVATQFADDQPMFGDPEIVEARSIGATCGGVRVWSLYVPNGRELGDPHYTYKLDWLAQLADRTSEWIQASPETPLALMGDWNVAPLDQDVWDMRVFEGSTHVSDPERAAFREFEARGLQDVVRPIVPDGYTYWDYKQLRFPRNEGMRIDFVLGSQAFADVVTDASIHRNERKGDAPSDHVPVVVDLDLDTSLDDDRPMIF